MSSVENEGPGTNGNESQIDSSIDGRETEIVEVDLGMASLPSMNAVTNRDESEVQLVGTDSSVNQEDDPTLEMSRRERVEHLKDLLRDGNVEEFNRLRPADKIDLSGIDLTGRNLDEVDLRDCDLTRAILEGTSLRNAKFQHSILEHANLRSSTLDNANLFGVEASHLDLQNVRSAVRADFRTAILNDSNFSDGTFYAAFFDGADLSSSRMIEANFNYASMSTHEEDQRANLTGCVLTRSTFVHANLSETWLMQANGQDVDFTEANLIGAIAIHSFLTSSHHMRAGDENTSDTDLEIRTTFKGAYVKDMMHDGFGTEENLLFDAINNRIPPEGEYEKAPEADQGFQLVENIPGSNAEVFYGAMTQLNNMIGLEPIKELIERQVDTLVVSLARQQKGLAELELGLNFILTGESGSGKTEVARILSKINHGLGLLKKGHLVETDKSGLVAGFLGQTPEKVNQVVKEALHGTLYLDEIYTLADDSYSQDAIAVLLKGMEDNRDNLSTILSGYEKEMEPFIRQNSGLASRITLIINLPSYSNGELVDIGKLFLEKKDLQWNSEFIAASSAFFELIQDKLRSEETAWGNAREARDKLVKQATTYWSSRIRREGKLNDYDALSSIEAQDIPFQLYFGVSHDEIPYKELEWAMKDPAGGEDKILSWDELPTDRMNKGFPELSEASVEKLKDFMEEHRAEKLEEKGFQITPEMLRSAEEIAGQRFPDLSDRARGRVARIIIEDQAREAS